MKKHIVICLVTTCMFVLMFGGCGSTNSVTSQAVTQTIPYDTRAIETPASINEQKNGDVFYGEFVYDDSVFLADGITKSYDLAQLETFFLQGDFNEAGIMYADSSVLSFRAVNEAFPAEIIRTRNYSVYKVKQGGYFYVFWMVAANANRATTEPYVRFSAYLSGDKTEEMFLSLEPGFSTAEDVKKIDPSFEMCFTGSPFCSYSYMSDEWVLAIYYSPPACSAVEGKEHWDYRDFVIKEMVFLQRGSCPTAYTSIQTDDLPERQGGGSVDSSGEEPQA